MLRKENNLRKILREEISDFILKPVSYDDLLFRIEKLVNKTYYEKKE